MSHAAELLARRREEALDPAEDLYLREHLAGCAKCRELDRSIVRADRLIAGPAPAIVPGPMAPPRARMPVRAILVGALTVVLVVAGAVAGNALRERRSGQDVAGSGPAFAASVPDLPPDWSLEIRNGLLFAVPANWDAASDARDIEINDPRPQVGLAMMGGTTIGEVVEGVRESGVLVTERAIPADRPMHAYATRSSSTSTERGPTLTQHVLVQIDERTIVALSVPEKAVPGDGGAASPDDAATLELVGRSLFVLQDTDDMGTKFTEEEVVAALGRAASLEHSVLPTVDAYGVYAVNGDKYSFAHVRTFTDRATRQRQDPNLTTIQSIADWVSPVTFRGVGNVLVMVGSGDVNVRYRLLRALDSLLYPTEVVPAPTPRPPPATPMVQSTPSPAGPQRSSIALYRPTDILDGRITQLKSWAIPWAVYQPVFAGPADALVLYESPGPGTTELRVIHLTTGREEVVSMPPLHLYSQIYPLPDGRLLATGPAVLIGSPGGPAMVIADVFSQNSALSPSGSELALWSYGENVIRIVDLTSGSVRTLPERYVRCGEDGVVVLTWSPDARELAAAECADEHGDLRTWIIDARTGARSHSVPDISVRAWPTPSELFGYAGFPPGGEPQYVRIRRTGEILSRHPAGEISPDARYIAARTIKAAPTAAEPQRRIGVATLVEIATGRTVELGEDVWAVGWTPDGDLYILTHEGGS